MTPGNVRAGLRAMTALALSACLVLPTSTASAWSNGVSGPNTYGTHDWILDKPIKKLKRRGKSVDWVRLNIALRATDDPDTLNGMDFSSGTWWHVYDIWGAKYGAAPTAVKFWFNTAARRLANGNRKKASRALGIMAHLLGDISNPLHTDGWQLEDLIHSPYEKAVDRRSRRTSNAYRFRFDGRHDPSPYRKTVHVAKVAHKSYATLVRAYNNNGYNKRVHRITRRQLNRGANALADVAAGIKAKAQSIKKKSGGGGGGDGGGGEGCHSSYPDFCIPPPPPDKDCGDINGSNFTVKGSDPHGFDSDGDGVGCES